MTLPEKRHEATTTQKDINSILDYLDPSGYTAPADMSAYTQRAVDETITGAWTFSADTTFDGTLYANGEMYVEQGAWITLAETRTTLDFVRYPLQLSVQPTGTANDGAGTGISLSCKRLTGNEWPVGEVTAEWADATNYYSTLKLSRQTAVGAGSGMRAFLTAVGNGDTTLTLTDDAGASKLAVANYSAAEKFAVDSLGNLTLSGTVDGVDISAHAADAAAHHAVFTTTEHTAIGNGAPHHAAVTAGAGIGVAGQQVSVDVTGNFTWTGSHIFQTTTTTRHILPELTDTYDLGSAAKLWRRGYLSELDTFLLVENAISVVGGIQVIGHGQGTLAAALAEGVGDTQIDVGAGTNLVVGDFILLRVSLMMEYLEIVSDDGGGLFTVTRDVDGSGRNAWPQGTVWLNLGQLGDGRIELSAATTPRISILRQGATYNVTTDVVRIGDMDGAFGIVAETYGLGVGDYAGSNYLRYDTTDGFGLVAGGGGTKIDETGLSLTVVPDDAYPRASAVTFVRSDDDSVVGDLAAQATATHSFIRLESRRDSASGVDVASTQISSFLDGEHGDALTYLSAWAHDRPTDPIVSFTLTASMDDDNDARLSGSDLAIEGKIKESTAITARAYRSYAQTIGSATWTALVFDRQVRDTDNIWGWTPLVFTGTGLDDMTREEGIYTSTTTVKDFVVEIDGTGAPDTFQWSDDGGVSWDATDVAITGANQTLTNGVIVKFAATTGHTLGDSWAWTERPMNRFTVQHDGDYLLGAVATLPPGSVDATGARFSVAFRVDGATYVSGGATFVTVSGAYCVAGEPPVSVYLTAGQYVEMMVIHGLAGNKGLHYGATFVCGWVSRQA